MRTILRGNGCLWHGTHIIMRQTAALCLNSATFTPDFTLLFLTQSSSKRSTCCAVLMPTRVLCRYAFLQDTLEVSGLHIRAVFQIWDGLVLVGGGSCGPVRCCYDFNIIWRDAHCKKRFQTKSNLGSQKIALKYWVSSEIWRCTKAQHCLWIMHCSTCCWGTIIS